MSLVSKVGGEDNNKSSQRKPKKRVENILDVTASRSGARGTRGTNSGKLIADSCYEERTDAKRCKPVNKLHLGQMVPDIVEIKTLECIVFGVGDNVDAHKLI